MSYLFDNFTNSNTNLSPEDRAFEYKGLDFRYDALFSVLVKDSVDERDHRIPENVNFISWNYDSQVEMAYSSLTQYDKYEQSEMVFRNAHTLLPCTSKTSRNGYVRNSHLIKLNGSANLFFDKKGEVNGLAERFKDSDLSILKFFVENLDVEPYLKFSFEKSSGYNKIIETTKDIILKTDALVIIGYSFPAYNRRLDKEILSIKPKMKVYYQIPEQDKIFKERCKGVSETFYNNCELNHDIGQFFIPYEY